jgi:uncharacterized membrane protein YgdD (TMEM256/DUF423 family)
MAKLLIIVSGISGALAVALGAFGAHALKKMLETSGRLDTFETAVKYHFYHTLALLLVGLLLTRVDAKLLEYAGGSFILGIILFSGSLYLLCFTGYTKLGIITPFGGLLLISGWLMMAWAAAKHTAW